MLLGFKARFVPYILEGSKTNTIRAIRKNPPKAGETCHCYTGLRTKGARLLGRFACIRVQDIYIAELERQSVPLVVRIDGVELSPEEADQLFWRDGFRDEGGERYTHLHQAARFWQGRLPFRGHLIHWKWTAPAPADGRRPAATNKKEKSDTMNHMKRLSLLCAILSTCLFAQTLHTVTLNWNWQQGSNSPATNFNIKRSTVAGACLATPPTAACTVIASPSLAVSATAVSGTYQYVDSGAALTTGTTFFYVVTATNSAGESAPTNQDSELIPPFAVGAPAAPTGLVGKSQ